jgi:pyrroloquinoline quinone biosynthesis protein D
MSDPVFKASSIPVLALGYRFQWEPMQDCNVLLYPEGMVRFLSILMHINKL